MFCRKKLFFLQLLRVFERLFRRPVEAVLLGGTPVHSDASWAAAVEATRSEQLTLDVRLA